MIQIFINQSIKMYLKSTIYTQNNKDKNKLKSTLPLTVS